MFKRLKRETIFDTPWITVYNDDVLDHHRTLLHYGIVHFKNESVVAVVKKGDSLLITENWRYPINRKQLEFPAGGIEEGETPQEAAHREVLEETGISILCRDPVYSFYPSNGVTDQKIHVVLADYVDGEPVPQDEILSCRWMKIDQVKEQILTGTITDAPTFIAYYWASNAVSFI